jgi:hypothetical protein
MGMQDFGQDTGDNLFSISSTQDIDETTLKELFLNGGSPAGNPEDIKGIESNEEENDNPPAKQQPKQKKDAKAIVAEEEKEDRAKTEQDLKDLFLGSQEEDEDEEGKPSHFKNQNPSKGSKQTPQQQEEDEDEDDYTGPFAELHKELLNMGVFTTDEGEEEYQITTPQEFQERWERESQKKAMNTLYDFLEARHGEEGLRVFEDIFQRGVSPQDYLSQYVRLQSVQNMDLQDEANQEQVLRMYYEAQGLDRELVNKKIQKHKDYSDMDEEAEIAHKWLVANEERQMQGLVRDQEARDKAKQQYQQHYHASLSQILNNAIKERNINGFPVTEKAAREIFDYVYTPKYRLGNQDDLTDFDKAILELRKPENYRLKVLIGLVLKSDGDLSKVKTQAISEETNKFFNKFVQKEKNEKRSQQQQQKSSGTFGQGL